MVPEAISVQGCRGERSSRGIGDTRGFLGRSTACPREAFCRAMHSQMSVFREKECARPYSAAGKDDAELVTSELLAS